MKTIIHKLLEAYNKNVRIVSYIFSIPNLEPIEVRIFILGEGVEYSKFSTDKFNIMQQVDDFLQSDKGKIIACGTCMDIRHQQNSKSCPIGGMEDLYSLIVTSDKVLTF